MTDRSPHHHEGAANAASSAAIQLPTVLPDRIDFGHDRTKDRPPAALNFARANRHGLLSG